MAAEGWDDFHRRWAGLKPPLRPDADVAATIAGLIAGHDDRVLLLGATPELSTLGEFTVAMDWSAPTVARIWPGSDTRRVIVHADWRTMPLAETSVSSAIGDGSLASLAWCDNPVLLDRLARLLPPGGRVAIRCYLAPDEPDRMTDICDDVLATGGGGFHALKWRLAMAVAADRATPDVPVTAILSAFDAAFPDRTALARATGWSPQTIGEIDAYAGSPACFTFPTAAELLAIVPAAFGEARFVPAGSYPLAERCPILALERA